MRRSPRERRQPRGGAAWLHLLTTVRAAPGSGWVALRAASTMLCALSVLTFVGAPDLSVYATFGAFATVYGGARRTDSRWRVQAVMGLVLSAGVTTGAVVALSPERAFWAVPVTALWAALAARWSDRFTWRPPGPMFLVFTVATCSSVPSDPSTLLRAVVVVVSTAAFAVALGVMETWLMGETVPSGAHPSKDVVHSRSRQRIQAVRCAVAVLIAGAIATASGINHPYWAMVACVVPMAAATFEHQVVRALHRMIGTVAGLALAWCLLLIPLDTFTAVVLIAVLQGATELVVARHYGAALLFITPLALLVTQQAEPQPVGELITARLLETAIGVVVGLAMVIVTRQRSSPGAAPSRGGAQ